LLKPPYLDSKGPIVISRITGTTKNMNMATKTGMAIVKYPDFIFL
jgi:hypothetical protein